MKLIASSAMALLSLTLVAQTGCHTTPKTEAAREEIQDDGRTALNTMKQGDTSLEEFMRSADSYAIFPDIGKGGLGVGGAYGHGAVYQNGQLVGYANVSQVSVGFQAGGQEYSELLVFQTPEALQRFKENKFSFAANASAVAVKSGAASAAKYDNGVAVFTQPKAGLMFEASIGGQKFNFQSLDQARMMNSSSDASMNTSSGTGMSSSSGMSSSGSGMSASGSVGTSSGTSSGSSMNTGAGVTAGPGAGNNTNINSGPDVNANVNK